MSDKLGEQKDLVLDYLTIKEIVKEINRKFMLHTDNVSFHFDEHAIQITIFPRRGQSFKLPYGPQDVRMKDSEFEFLQERDL